MKYPALRFVVPAILCLALLSPVARSEQPAVNTKAIKQLRAELMRAVEQLSQQHEREMALLRAQLDSLMAIRSVTDFAGISDDSLLLSVVQELAELRAENEYLRNRLERSRQYASSEDGGFSDGREYDRLTAIVAAINDSLRNSTVAEESAFASEDQATQEAATLAQYGLSGWIDASGSSDYNARQSDFSLNQIEVDFETGLSEQSSLRADVEYNAVDAGEFSMDLEQGYVDYGFGAKKMMTGTFGKFNALLGVEAPDPDETCMYSYSLLTTLSLPVNLTGLALSVQPSDRLNARVILINGWDINADNNHGKTVGGRLDLEPVSGLNLSVAAITGPELENNSSSHRTVLDGTIRVQPLSFWETSFEAVTGQETNLTPEDGLPMFAPAVLTGPNLFPRQLAPKPPEDGPSRSPMAAIDDGTARWSGLSIAHHLHLREQFAIHIRSDYFRDRDGWRTGLPQELYALALAPRVTLADGLDCLVELREDWSNKSFFTEFDGSPSKSQITSALQIVYSF